MGGDQSESLATCSTAAADTRRGVFNHEAAAGIYTCAFGPEQVRIWSRMEILNRSYRSQSDGAYSGFPFFTSSDTTNASGTGTPTAIKAEVAYTTVAEVHIAHFGFGSLWNGPI